MQIRRMAICFILGIGAAALCAPARASVLADSVNGSLAADNAAYWGVDDVGWLYTPASSYDLIGINTFFSIPTGTSIENRTVTTVVYLNDTPTNGGTLLGSFSFDSSLAEGQLGGGSFSSPITLTAGQQYFVGFENVGPMSPTPNVNDLGVNFTADPSATFLSSTFLDVAGNATCPNPDTFACVDSNHDFLSQPILQFFAQPASTTPEPGSGALLGGALMLGLVYALRSRRNVALQSRDR
jgi:hypothetical protein